MCIVEKFFFCVSLDLGCLILGFTTFVLGGFMATCSVVVLMMEHHDPGKGVAYLDSFPEVVLNSAANFILWTSLMLAVLWMLFSVMLILGIRKNKSSYVLWYFSFGTILTILCMLSALLVLLQNHWILALVKLIISMIYIHCLAVVHTTYDLMLVGTMFKLNERQLSDETILVDSMEDV